MAISIQEDEPTISFQEMLYWTQYDTNVWTAILVAVGKDREGDQPPSARFGMRGGGCYT